MPSEARNLLLEAVLQTLRQAMVLRTDSPISLSFQFPTSSLAIRPHQPRRHRLRKYPAKLIILLRPTPLRHLRHRHASRLEINRQLPRHTVPCRRLRHQSRRIPLRNRVMHRTHIQPREQIPICSRRQFPLHHRAQRNLFIALNLDLRRRISRLHVRRIALPSPRRRHIIVVRDLHLLPAHTSSHRKNQRDQSERLFHPTQPTPAHSTLNSRFPAVNCPDDGCAVAPKAISNSVATLSPDLVYGRSTAAPQAREITTPATILGFLPLPFRLSTVNLFSSSFTSLLLYFGLSLSSLQPHRRRMLKRSHRPPPTLCLL